MASWLMIRLPGTFWGVCDTPLHKPDNHVLNTYRLNPILDKDGIPYSTDLPIRIKNWILFYPLNQKLGTRGYVFNRYIPGMTLIG